jgi:FxsC-like protein
MGFQATVHEFEDEVDDLLTTTQPEHPSVVLVDRWALMDGQRAEKVRRLDQKNYAWVSVVEPWNPEDRECTQHERVLDGLSENALWHSRGGSRPTLRDGAGRAGPPGTLDEFRGALERAVMRASTDFGHPGPPRPPGTSGRPRLD